MFFSYSWCFVAARAACGHTKLIKRPRSAKPQPEYRLAQGIFRKRPVTALCFCLHLTIGQSPLFMRVCEGRKICPRKFKICPTYFELCALYFFFSQRGVKNTFHVLTLCPAPDSGFGCKSWHKACRHANPAFRENKLQTAKETSRVILVILPMRLFRPLPTARGWEWPQLHKPCLQRNPRKKQPKRRR